MREFNRDPKLKRLSEIEQCENKIIYLKDLRGKIPHNNIVTKELRDADTMLFNQIKHMEEARNSILGKK